LRARREQWKAALGRPARGRDPGESDGVCGRRQTVHRDRGRLWAVRVRAAVGGERMRRMLISAILLVAAADLAAQSPKVPRTADGRPDLQGIWDFAQLTPLERPSAFAGKDAVTAEEAEEFAQ